MIIRHNTWIDYVNTLRICSDMAESDMAEYMADHAIEAREDRRAVVDYAYALVQKYGEGAAEMSCRMYDSIAAATGKNNIPEAEPHVPGYGDVAKATYGAFKTPNPHYEVPSAVNRQVKLAAVDTTMKNAIRDGAEWAWIPQGDTCAFCLTLAANGWQPASKAALKGDHAEHIHKHCDCTYCIRFDADTTVEGYDPEMYRQMYDEADGSSSKEKINSLRREMQRGGSEGSVHTGLHEVNKSTTISTREKPEDIQIRASQMPAAKGKERAERYGAEWRSADMHKIIEKLVPEAVKSSANSHGKIIYENGGRYRVVYDVGGRYFRIEDTHVKGRRRYADLDGTNIANKTENGRTFGRSKEEYERLTHFRNEEDGSEE